MKKIYLTVGLLLSFSAFASEDGLWQNIYQQTAESYIDDVRIEDLAVSALKNIKKTDKNLQIGNDSSRVTLYYKGKVVKVLRKPEDVRDAAGWGKLTAVMAEAAVKNSPEASDKDFELTDVMAEGMLQALDKDSKFYKDIDDVGRIKNRRFFAARDEGNLCYIKIGAFNKQTLEEIKKALEEAKGDGLILDLRGCPGGMSGEAIRAASLFLDGGIIASVRGKDKQEETYYNAEDGDILHGKPIFILVDGDTASAAEILTMALKDQGRAKVIGTRTKGKGSMQKLIGLPNGSVLAVTNSFFFSPSGQAINGEGIEPDICTFEMPENKNIENLLRQKNDSCGREQRENSELELETAAYLAQN